MNDLLGFVLSDLQPADAQTRAAADLLASKRLSKPVWRAFSANGELPSDASLAKRMFRKGVPHHLRCTAWLAISGAAAARKAAAPAAQYQALLARLPVDTDVVAERQIDQDLHRTFPSHPAMRSESTRAQLRRVLVALARASPQRGYCQSMNYVSAFALMVFQADEENAFWLLHTALASKAPPELYSRDLQGLHCELKVLEELAEQKSPKAAKKLKALLCLPSLWATEELMTLFTCTLPSETCLRVWDAWLFEGPKVLLRVALALLRRAEPALQGATSLQEAVSALRAAGRGAYDRDELLDEAWRLVGSMPTAKLAKLREKAQAEEVVRKAEDAARKAAQPAGSFI